MVVDLREQLEQKKEAEEREESALRSMEAQQRMLQEAEVHKHFILFIFISFISARRGGDGKFPDSFFYRYPLRDNIQQIYFSNSIKNAVPSKVVYFLPRLVLKSSKRLLRGGRASFLKLKR